MPVAAVHNQRIDGLPSPPGLLAALFQALDDESTSATDLERLVAQDQSTTARLLSVANSVYYGLRHQVSSVARAVVVLGLEEVRSVCLGSVLTSLLHPNRFEDPTAAADLWRHSLAVSQAARLIAQRLPSPRPEVALTAGLLHDLGWVVLMVYRPPLWDRLRQWRQRDGLSLRQAEARLGFDHQRAGATLARQWDLPPVLAAVLGRHHDPVLGDPHFACVATVGLAESLAAGLGSAIWDETPPAEALPPAPWLLGGLGLSGDAWRDCQAEMAGRQAALAALADQLLGQVA